MMRGGNIKNPPWSQAQDDQLRLLYAKLVLREITLADIAATIGKSVAGCACRAGHLGISMSRRKWMRRKKERKAKSLKYSSEEERQAALSIRVKKWHSTHPHPMAGKEVPQSVRDKISAANIGRHVTQSQIAAMMKTKAANGTFAPKWETGRSWRSGWRIIGRQRIFARSRWEANYARYLEFLRVAGQIQRWEHEPETFWFEAIRRGTRSYLPDFRVTLLNGSVEYHETKGWMDARSQTKIKRMKKYHPSVILRVIGAQWFRDNHRKLRGLIPDWEHGKI